MENINDTDLNNKSIEIHSIQPQSISTTNKPRNSLYLILSIIWLTINLVLIAVINYKTTMAYPGGMFDFREIDAMMSIIIEIIIGLPIIIAFYKSQVTINNLKNDEVIKSKGKYIFLCIIFIIYNFSTSFAVISRINYLNKYSYILLIPIYFTFTVLLLRFHLTSIFANKFLNKIKNNLISNTVFVFLFLLTIGLSAFVCMYLPTIFNARRDVVIAEGKKEYENSIFYFTYYKEFKENIGDIKETIYLGSWADSPDKFIMSNPTNNMRYLYIIKETHFNQTLNQSEIIKFIKEKEEAMFQACFKSIPDVYKAELKTDFDNKKYLVEYIKTLPHNIDLISDLSIDKNVNKSNILFLKSLGFSETKERGSNVEKNFGQELGSFSKDCRYPAKLNY